MSDLSQQPSISIIIPTLNSERVLNDCLESVFSQDYPHELLEILIIDAGSDDDTLSIVTAFSQRKGPGIKKVSNPLKTGEAGKAVGVRTAENDLIAFIDSDNILPESVWLRKMIEPFEDRNIIATEPLEYTYRAADGYINRYCAMLGMNDPLCLFMGNYDRHCTLTNKWTDMHVQEKDRGEYLEVRLTEKSIPTIGANGFLIRSEVLSSLDIGDYLFDVDVLAMLLDQRGSVTIGKVKTGIIHLYCSDLKTFFRKQKRRIVDYYSHKTNDRQPYVWDYRKKNGLMVFIFSCLTLLPLFLQSFTGISRKADLSWFFHPIACFLTFYIYGLVSFSRLLGIDNEQSRLNWSQ